MSDPLRLFLIEDDEEHAFLMRKHLERAGHHVITCRTAADALIVLGHSTFDLVILDHDLTDMKGFDLLDALKRDGISTSVVVITQWGDEKLAAQYLLRPEVLDYVPKDSALAYLAELPKRVNEAVTRHRLQEFNRLLIEALESARDGIMIADLQGKLLHVNRALERMTGYERHELLGQTPRLFEDDTSAPGFFADLFETVRVRGSWQGEVISRRKDDTLLDASLTMSAIVDIREQLTHFVGIYRDIGEQRQLERQLLQAQKMQSVGTLAGGVAHEFNNLLAGIQGYASLGLREARLPEIVKEFFQYIVELSDRAANLTRQLLAFARKPALSRQPTRMGKLVRDTAELVRQTLSVEVVLDLHATATDGGPLAAQADANQLQQVLINLALNARDATQPPAPITFRLRQAVLAGELPAFPENVPPGDYVVVEVQDQGSGMSAEVLNQALDPFFTTKEVGQGTGLGLPVAFGIMHGHKGFLTIDSEPARGTCVGLYLPRLAGPVTERQPPGPTPEPARVPARDILVIDDEEAVLDVVRRFLEIAGHRVLCATSGREGLAALSHGRPIDLVVLDLMIPQEEGATTFKQLRQYRPDLPVLLCTGLLQADPAPALLEAEGVRLLRKPFRMHDLWDVVNQALA
jgi:two-component system, cell cycle sensor histidine kinase and response regulator CckA